jgi:hypothetical protein
VAKVELSFRRGTGRYWDGTGFAGTSEVWLTAAGTTSWSFAFAASSFPSQGTYTVRVRATDGAGNVGAPTATSFVYDTAAPTSTVTFPVATRSYTTTSWTAGCPTPGVCGTAADAGSGVRSVEISIRRGSGNYWNGTAFGSGAEVYLPAVGTNAWQFAFAASNFPQLKANYTIHVRATDNAGNVRSPSSTKFTFSP